MIGQRLVPELEQSLAAFARNGTLSITFVPHVVPMDRGIMSTLYLRAAVSPEWERVDRVYREFYRGAPFVRIRPKDQWPQVRDATGTNYCDLAFSADVSKRLLIVVAAIDNLLKGASGQAVQNLNGMYGWPEPTGLL